MYYLHSRYYDPALGRFINADGIASIGQGIIGANLFAYCGNDPTSRFDTTGYDWDCIGFGVQIDISGSLGEISIGGGVEVIIYWGTEEVENHGAPVVAVYAYGEGNIDLALFGEDIASVITVLTENVELLKVDGASALQSITLTNSHAPSLTISASGFFVWGNEDFQSADDYTGWFDNISVGLCKARVNYAKSDCCRTFGAGYVLFGGSSRVGLNCGKSYYWLLWSSAE